ncbi:hypothetical protein [Variovorax paradoxus]|uniref:hypothetical protein n=1 Tax=Variovorax paradoxus TaxID=34073 RepID=UPI0012DAE02B|nr:hypothetical protein [Variovorax paradoxus]
MSNIYNTQLNEFSHKFLLRGHYTPTASDQKNFPFRFDRLRAQIFENLMLFDKSTFKVYGENVPLAILTNELSVKGLEQLIEQGALSFVLWTPLVAHMETKIPGVIPLVSGRVSSEVHTDPEHSIDAGLACLARKPNKDERMTIKRKVRDLYIIPKDGLEAESTDLALSAFKSNKLKPFGLDSETADIYDLSPQQIKILGQCGEDLLEYKFSISEQLTVTNNSRFEPLLADAIDKIKKSDHKEVFAHLADIEHFPDLQEVYSILKDPFKQLPKLRDKKNIKKFRQWLNEVTTESDMKQVTRAYIEAISDATGFFETKSGRFTKTVAMALAGAAVGSFAGPAGAVIGGMSGKILEPAVNFGLDLVDEYFISELTKGWTPRTFFDEMRKAKIVGERG